MSSRNRPALTISVSSTRRANPCSSSRAVSSSTAATVAPTATHGGSASTAGPSEIGQHVADRHHQADVGKPIGVGVVQVAPVVAGEPRAQRQQPGAERQQMCRIKVVQQRTVKASSGKVRMPPGRFWIGSCVKLFEGEAKEEPEAKEQQQADYGRSDGHPVARSATKDGSIRWRGSKSSSGLRRSLGYGASNQERRRRCPTEPTCSISCRRHGPCAG